MAEVVILNDMTADGLRRLHVMAEAPVRAWMKKVPKGARVRRYQDEIRMHHLEAAWQAREAMLFDFRRYGEKRTRPVCVWALEPGQRISEGAVDAALTFFSAFGYWPSAAWVRTWPQGLAEDDAFIPIGDGFGLDLFAVPWVPAGFVVVGGEFNRYQDKEAE